MTGLRGIGLALVVLFVVGMSGPAGSTPAKTTTSAATVNVASDRSTAQAINLTSADLVGWQESPNPPNASDQSLNSQMSACAGGPAPKTIDVVDVTSANFDKGPTELSSDVTMVRTHADGLADLRSIRGHKALGCFRRVLVPLLTQQLPGVKVAKLKVSDFRPSESLPDEFGIQLSLTLSGKPNGVSVSISLSIREIGFLVDRAEVSLNESEKGKATPVSIESTLIHTLDQRARANTSA